MFPDDLQRLASKKKVEFNIELAQWITYISKASYRMALTKL